MPTVVPKMLSSYIDTGAIDRAVEQTGGSTFSALIKNIPALMGGFVGAAIGWVTGSFLGKWVAGWFSDKLSESELRSHLVAKQVIPAFSDIVNYDNLKATENESRGALSILNKVYGDQCVSTAQPNTHLNLPNFIDNYKENELEELARLSDTSSEIGKWWDTESARLIAEGNEKRQTWFAMYNALVCRKLEIIWARIEEVLGEDVNNPETLEEILKKKEETVFSLAGFELNKTMLLIGGVVLFMLFKKG